MLNRRSVMLATAATAAAAPVGGGGSAAAKGTTEVFMPAQQAWSPPPAQAAAQSGLAKLSHINLFYWDTGGAGQPVVFLHPMTGSHEVWPYQQPVFAKAGYRVIGYSRRGFYQSDPNSPAAGGSDVEDLRELLALLKADRPHLVASAAGGFTAMDFVRRWPKDLRSLTIASSIAGAAPPPTGGAARGSLQIPGWMQLPASFRELSPSYRAANPAGVAQWEAFEQRSTHGPRPAFNPAAPAAPLDRASLPPMLVLTGDADLYMPPPMLRDFARSLPGARSAVFAEAGHAVFWEQPNGFNKVVLDFLKSA